MFSVQLERRLREINPSLYEREGTYLRFGGEFGLSDAFNCGAQHLLGGETIIYPLCFHNSYWSGGQVERDILALSTAFSGNVHFFVADGPAQDNYKALGKTEEDARRMTLRQTQQLGNKISGATDLLKDKLGPKAEGRVSRSHWEAVENDATYKEERAKFLAMYEQNPSFKDDIDSLTRQVLSQRHYDFYRATMAPERFSDAAVAGGKNYPIKELAFVASSLKRLGVEKIVIAYHKDWEVYRKWADGTYDGEAKPQYGFSIIRATKGRYEPSQSLKILNEDIAGINGFLSVGFAMVVARQSIEVARIPGPFNVVNAVVVGTPRRRIRSRHRDGPVEIGGAC